MDIFTVKKAIISIVLKNAVALRIMDFVLSPVTFFASCWFKFARSVPLKKLPITEHIFMKVGLLPIQDHYYQPMINPKRDLRYSLRASRNLPQIEWNIDEQLSLLSRFNYNDELLKFPVEKAAGVEFFYNNGAFCSGDAEYLYSMVRHLKPAKILEIGSGYSTLIIKSAIEKNRQDDHANSCTHICIDPYEKPWLKKIEGIDIIKEKVENMGIPFFGQLSKNDILFIDSSHIIRPQGDVLFEYLELLPALNSKVVVHLHDIFTPRDYLDDWVHAHLLWNEQYLLEAFLSYNKEFKIIGALNFLMHNHYIALASKCPILAKQTGREPGSFWMVKR